MSPLKLLAVVTVMWVLPTATLARAQDVVQYYHTDAVGSVRMMTDANGQVIKRFDYLPFGELWPGDPPDRRQFAGKERDAETGFDYVGARYYASQTGRFTTVDPVVEVDKALVDPQRWNRYVYVRNNPLRYVDPDGRAIETVWDLISLGLSAKAVWQDPTSGWNWVSLGADVVSVLGPGIPAVGMAIRGGSTLKRRRTLQQLPELSASTRNIWNSPSRSEPSGSIFRNRCGTGCPTSSGSPRITSFSTAVSCVVRPSVRPSGFQP